jgi:hypothetical protein
MNCKLCDNLIISTAVTSTADGLVITIPSGSYADGCRYCIVIAQAIPTTVTIGTEVLVQIGTGATYPLIGANCRPVTVCGIRSRRKYPVAVETTATSGIFRMLGRSCCQCGDNLRALEG